MLDICRRKSRLSPVRCGFTKNLLADVLQDNDAQSGANYPIGCILFCVFMSWTP